MRAPEIRARLQRSGRSQAALARHLGKSTHSVSRLLTGQRTMDVTELAQIREFFAEDEPTGPAYQQIPVYGYAAAGGEDRISLAGDQVIDHIEIPVGLVRGEAFGVRTTGDSMEPRLFAGETVIVGRGVRPAKFGDCIVELNDGTGLVKQYVGLRDGWLFLHQWNPDQEVRIEQSKVRAIHAVLYRR